MSKATTKEIQEELLENMKKETFAVINKYRMAFNRDKEMHGGALMITLVELSVNVLLNLGEDVVKNFDLPTALETIDFIHDRTVSELKKGVKR